MKESPKGKKQMCIDLGMGMGEIRIPVEGCVLGCWGGFVRKGTSWTTAEEDAVFQTWCSEFGGFISNFFGAFLLDDKPYFGLL